MSRFPGAVWIPSPNCNPGTMMGVLGVVMHTNIGTLSGTDSWFSQSASQVSSHFGIAFDGTVHQYVDTDDVAWHAGYDANHHYHGIEFEDGGNPNTPMTPAQIDTGGQVIIWLWSLYRWPVKPATHFGDSGVIGHVEVWPAGGHTCPNPTRLAQKLDLIRSAWGHLPGVATDQYPAWISGQPAPEWAEPFAPPPPGMKGVPIVAGGVVIGEHLQ